MGSDRMKARSNLSIYDFLREFGRVAPLVYAHDNNNAELVIVPAYPDELVRIATSTNMNPTGNLPPTITYQVVRREPATIQDHPFQERKQIKPMHAEMINDVESGEPVELSHQLFDNFVQLDCWTTSNGDADDMIEWLENFMVEYAFYFKERGVHEMYYYRGGRFTWGTTEEEAMARWRNPFKVRSMTYYIRTQKLWYKVLSRVQSIIAQIEVSDTL